VALPLVLLLCGVFSAGAQASNVRANGEVITTCSSVTFRFFGFPNANNNTVTEKVFEHGVLEQELQFTFNGPTGENTVPIKAVPGGGLIDARAKWNTNGFQSGYDIATWLNCSKPAFTIEKQQEIEGSLAGFTTAQLNAKVGQTVDYKIIVTNTGNTVLTLQPLVDKNCTGLTGGPLGPLLPEESTVYYCSHTLIEANEVYGLYENTATLTAGSPIGQGGPVHHSSNRVVVVFPKSHERPNGELEATCTSMTFKFFGFPNANNNTVYEKVFVHGVLVASITFHFNGPTGSNTVPIVVPPGIGMVDGRAKWNTNGFKGGFDIGYGVNC